MMLDAEAQNVEHGSRTWHIKTERAEFEAVRGIAEMGCITHSRTANYRHRTVRNKQGLIYNRVHVPHETGASTFPLIAR